MSTILRKEAFSSCPFCSPEVLKLQTFYEDPSIAILYSYKPFFEGHCLIIPKRHIERFEDLSIHEMCSISTAIKKLHLVTKRMRGQVDYFLIQKNGRSAGQSVSHLHVHYIPVPYRSKRGRFFRLVIQLVGYPFFKKIPPSKMRSMVHKLKKEMIE